MTTNSVSKEQIEALIAGLEGVTPGPWEAVTQEEWNKGFDFFGGVDGAFAFPIEGEPLDVAHIGRCDPGTLLPIFNLAIEALDARTSSGGVTNGEVVSDEMVEVVAKFIASDLFRYSWEGLGSEGRITDSGFKPIIYSMDGGMQLQGRQDDLRDLARALLTAALAGSNGE